MEAFLEHLARCASCTRYDRVVGGGVEVFRTLPELTPSSDFALRLEYRLEQLDREAAHRAYASGTSLAVTLSIAVAIGVTAWMPAMLREPEPVRLPPVLAHAPSHPELVPPLFRANPLLALPAPVPVTVRSAASRGVLLGSHGPLGSLASYTPTSPVRH